MRVAMIPARGGSKRVPGKNIKPFHGKPILAYVIEVARKTGLFDAIVVSTDSEDIAEVARQHGAETPFLRPERLADDFATTASVVSHCLDWYVTQGNPVTEICCLYPTAVLLQAKYIQAGYDLLQSRQVATVLSVAEFDSSPFRAMRLGDDGTLGLAFPEYELTRTQDLPAAYYDAGQFYWLCAQTFIKNPRLYAEDALSVIIPSRLVQDIDTENDWRKAELLFEIIEKQREK